jgi:hypothetical protein
MDPAMVLGIEVRQFTGDQVRTLVPILIGQTAEAQRRKGGPAAARRKWDEQTFFDAVATLPLEVQRAIQGVHSWARAAHAHLSWGSGIHRGTYSVIFPSIHPKSVITVFTTGELSLNFKWMRDTPAGEAFAIEFGRRAEELALPLPSDYLERYPVVQPDRWAERWDALVRIIDEARSFAIQAADAPRATQ